MNQQQRGYVEPRMRQAAYTCPYCGVLAQQDWNPVAVGETAHQYRTEGPNARQEHGGAEEGWPREEGVGMNIIKGAQREGAWMGRCENRDCRKETLWVGGEMVIPRRRVGPPNHGEMPDEVRELYREAGLIAEASPRAAAALLRKATERLCNRLTDTNKNLSDTITALKKGRKISTETLKAMHMLRLIGNDAVHATEAINFDEHPEMADGLMRLLNRIVQEAISEPREAEELLGSLPAGIREKVMGDSDTGEIAAMQEAIDKKRKGSGHNRDPKE